MGEKEIEKEREKQPKSDVHFVAFVLFEVKARTDARRQRAVATYDLLPRRDALVFANLHKSNKFILLASTTCGGKEIL